MKQSNNQVGEKVLVLGAGQLGGVSAGVVGSGGHTA
ncbi:oxidoreductase [Salmonella enterica subsp. enterica]|uniref:Oxidoreductase n=1 Tax=Salmonella enterica I TaxID=59201 RepID=A0A379VQL3_SALET|nr:oxidoreductase [Salmonella enterica subsp. enterica]VEA00039.1 oxidoreductase [Salmonella enterica subsp. enterica]